ncbi:MAG: MBOAT family protein [Candidatus Krumholzibacteriota bacterium]|nr:MBOAT family protein [Candidatus Krumholzibacteriota bacterium]
MLFNSIHFLVFFPVVVCLYFLLPHRWRWALLLVTSYYFYMCWKMEYIFLILISTVVAYLTAMGMSRSEKEKTRKTYLVLSLLVNLGLLFGFKYFNFFNDNARILFDRFNILYSVPTFRVLLPVGISFYTFQTLSYTIDVYRGETPVQKHLGYFAVYVSFFPQLVAGPIERSGRLLPQFFEKHGFSYSRATSGLKLMLWGFFKKIVIADRLAVLVNSVYNEPSAFPGTPVLVATFFFAFQIYCDFSGYSDIAIGSARIMGFELMENFRQPYFSRSISEFWKRWHISLSTWFRDYLYIPLGGNRVSRPKWYYNLMATFVVSGLWHGANWTFLCWGALHGLFLVTENILGPPARSIARALSINTGATFFKGIAMVWTFFLVCAAWVLFRANSLHDVGILMNSLVSDPGQYLDVSAIGLSFRGMGLKTVDLVQSFVFIGVLLAYDIIDTRYDFWKLVDARPLLVRWTIYYAIIILILFFSPYNKAQNFIYFQF